MKFWGQSIRRGRYLPIYQQAGKAFISLITLRSISETRACYWGQDKTARDCIQISASKLVTTLYQTVIGLQLRPKPVTSSHCFCRRKKSTDCYCLATAVQFCSKRGVLSKVDAWKLITRWVLNCDIRMFVVLKFTALSRLLCAVPVFKTASAAATATKPRLVVRDRGRIGGLMDIIDCFGEFLTRPLPLRNKNQRRFEHVFVILVLYWGH